MIGGVASILVAQAVDLASLVVVGLSRAANVAFLRLVTLLLAQALDLATFSVMVGRHGPIAEANPIVSDLFLAYGMPAVVFAKLTLVVLVGALTAAAWARGRRGVWSVVGGFPLAVAIAVGLIGGITNAATYLAR
ncbi:MAG TPA: hypothetical protein VFI69_05235 [Candidatus Limnocylindrales bacterium]|nr:hypothetical protein [Candidatus Limnocylindrales bacterium]